MIVFKNVIHRKGAKDAKFFLLKHKCTSLRPLRLCGENCFKDSDD